MTLEQAIQLATQHHQAGRLNEAEALYREILAHDPSHADVLYYLAGLMMQTGRASDALPIAQRAVAASPNSALPRIVLGDALLSLGRDDAAINEYRGALAIDGRFADAWMNLGVALQRAKRSAEAVDAYRRAIDLQPANAQIHQNLAIALRVLGRHEEAIAAARKAVRLKPGDAATCNSLGQALFDAGRFHEAEAAFRSALAADASYAEGYNNLGNALRELGRAEDCIAAFGKSLAIRPNDATTLSNLGNALLWVNRGEEALVICRQAVAADPTLPEAWNHLGNVLRETNRLTEAADAYRAGLRFAPDDHVLHNNLGNVLRGLGQITPALAAFRKSISLKTDYPIAWDNLLYTLHFDPTIDAQAIADQHLEWARQLADPLMPSKLQFSNDRSPDRKLRIGYLSPDFRNHPVGRFIQSILEHHNAAQFEVVCYASSNVNDALTDSLRKHAALWRSTVGVDDEALANLIRADRIDILIDLAGHTADNRLLALARKPAPIQVSYLGYPDTTGMRAIDYRLVDELSDPPGEGDAFHSEKLWRLKTPFLCYASPADVAPAAPPSATRGHITFGSFNNLAKISPPAMRLWAKILERIPRSRLLMKAPGLLEATSQSFVRDALVSQGVPIDRVDLMPPTRSHEDHLLAYRQADIALDTFPYNGTTTTCESLAMGVPVIALAGRTHVARMGVDLLTRVGLTDLIANDEDSYVSIAEKLAGNTGRLAEIHQTLAADVRKSDLCNARLVTRSIEDAYRSMWLKFISEHPQTAPPSGI